MLGNLFWSGTACRGMETTIDIEAAGNMTTKGLGETVDTLLTAATNLLTYGVGNLAEVCPFTTFLTNRL